jgi:hypothetical protein
MGYGVERTWQLCSLLSARRKGPCVEWFAGVTSYFTMILKCLIRHNGVLAAEPSVAALAELDRTAVDPVLLVLGLRSWTFGRSVILVPGGKEAGRRLPTSSLRAAFESDMLEITSPALASIDHIGRTVGHVTAVNRNGSSARIVGRSVAAAQVVR